MKEYYKVYEVLGPLTEPDIVWLRSSNIPFEIDREMYKVNVGTYGQSISGTVKLLLFVNDDKQDTWLNLYWSDRIFLKVDIHSATIKYNDTI